MLAIDTIYMMTYFPIEFELEVLIFQIFKFGNIIELFIEMTLILIQTIETNIRNVSNCKRKLQNERVDPLRTQQTS
jgi:hypothetical protein